MTTPEPVAPPGRPAPRSRPRDGVTRSAMSDTEPGSRVMAPSTSDSSVPGASSGVSALVRVSYQPTPAADRTDQQDGEQRQHREPDREVAQAQLLPALRVDDDRARLLLRRRRRPARPGRRGRTGRATGRCGRRTSTTARGGAPPAGPAAGGSCSPAARSPDGRRRGAGPRRAAAAGRGAGSGRSPANPPSTARPAEGGLLAGRRRWAATGRGGQPVGHVRRTARSGRAGARRAASGTGGTSDAACRSDAARAGPSSSPGVRSELLRASRPGRSRCVPTVSVRTTGGTTSVCWSRWRSRRPGPVGAARSPRRPAAG